MAVTEQALRIALLIDEILTELSTSGVINVRRAYGNCVKSGLDGWLAGQVA